MALEPITRQERIIAGKDLEPITRMEKFLKEYGGGGGGGSASEYFETVGGDTLTWDGNTEGLAVDNLGILYKVSELTLTAEDIVNGVSCYFGEEITLSSSEIESDSHAMYIGGVVAVIYEAGVGVDLGDGCVFPEKGVYFMKEGDTYTEYLTINGYTGFPTTKLKEEYLPNGMVVDLGTPTLEDGCYLIEDVSFTPIFAQIEKGGIVTFKISVSEQTFYVTPVSSTSIDGVLSAGVMLNGAFTEILFLTP